MIEENSKTDYEQIFKNLKEEVKNCQQFIEELDEKIESYSIQQGVQEKSVSKIHQKINHNQIK